MNLSGREFQSRLPVPRTEESLGGPPIPLSIDPPHAASMRRYATALLCGGTVADTVDGPGIARGLRAGRSICGAHGVHAVHSTGKTDRLARHVAALFTPD